MKDCELCNSLPAKMFCESDEANLCWNCDTKVHSANFLVARHMRKLLCYLCQSPTDWQASGVSLCPTQSLCKKCFARSAVIPKSDESDNQVVPAATAQSASAETNACNSGKKQERSR